MTKKSKLIEKMLHCTVGTMCFCIFVYSRLYNFPKEDNYSTPFYIKFKTHTEAKHSNQGRIEPRHFRFVFMVTPLPGSTKRKKNCHVTSQVVTDLYCRTVCINDRTLCNTCSNL